MVGINSFSIKYTTLLLVVLLNVGVTWAQEVDLHSLRPEVVEIIGDPVTGKLPDCEESGFVSALLYLPRQTYRLGEAVVDSRLSHRILRTPLGFCQLFYSPKDGLDSLGESVLNLPATCNDTINTAGKVLNCTLSNPHRRFTTRIHLASQGISPPSGYASLSPELAMLPVNMLLNPAVHHQLTVDHFSITETQGATLFEMSNENLRAANFESLPILSEEPEAILIQKILNLRHVTKSEEYGLFSFNCTGYARSLSRRIGLDFQGFANLGIGCQLGGSLDFDKPTPTERPYLTGADHTELELEENKSLIIRYEAHLHFDSLEDALQTLRKAIIQLETEKALDAQIQAKLTQFFVDQGVTLAAVPIWEELYLQLLESVDRTDDKELFLWLADLPINVFQTPKATEIWKPRIRKLSLDARYLLIQRYGIAASAVEEMNLEYLREWWGFGFPSTQYEAIDNSVINDSKGPKFWQLSSDPAMPNQPYRDTGHSHVLLRVDPETLLPDQLDIYFKKEDGSVCTAAAANPTKISPGFSLESYPPVEVKKWSERGYYSTVYRSHADLTCKHPSGMITRLSEVAIEFTVIRGVRTSLLQVSIGQFGKNFLAFHQHPPRPGFPRITGWESDLWNEDRAFVLTSRSNLFQLENVPREKASTSSFPSLEKRINESKVPFSIETPAGGHDK